jgi:CubicO group peptidase (beta-lactamase class C family)
MMAHQAGLKSWIPFYIKTLKNGELNPEIYRSTKDSLYAIEVAENIFIHKDYSKYMYDKILSNPLGPKKYKYSDLCYYFTQKVFESILDEGQDVFLHRAIYKPMGLQNIRYSPLNHFEKERIVPTEHDQKFRKQIIHGYVHDPGAAMLGGVGGHAGIFSNTADLASIMQLFLKNGSYAGNDFFTAAIREKFTKKQFENNRRGIGFDRPRESGGGTCDKLASQISFGHSGFTGALAWADPKDEVIFIFLSNRVHPEQENWKIRDMNIRTDMQHVVYKAINR